MIATIIAFIVGIVLGFFIALGCIKRYIGSSDFKTKLDKEIDEALSENLDNTYEGRRLSKFEERVNKLAEERKPKPQFPSDRIG